MEKYLGKSVYSGIAAGPVLILNKKEPPVKREKAEDPEKEIARIDQAVVEAQDELQSLYEKARTQVGEAGAAIFEVHRMMLEDEDYLEAIENLLRTEQVSAEYAVAVTGDNFAEMFAGMENEYMKARSSDVKDISNLLIRKLSGEKKTDVGHMQPFVLLAEDLSPSETVQLDQEKLLAIATVQGSMNSHTAILARMMNIPALIQVPLELSSLRDGMTAVVDGFSGELILEPDSEVLLAAKKRQQEEIEKNELLTHLKGKDNVTLGGREISVYANVRDAGDVGYVLENDAGGIGLLRSEFLYLGRETLPTEEELLISCRHILQTMGEKKVIIRTLDIGADKQAPCLPLEQEENPALGCRGIRFCLKHSEIFKTQLRALWRASVYGNLSVMYPMISSLGEMDEIARIVGEVEEELEELQVPYRTPEQGIMIETPAAALIAEELAQRADFFSIGTNDLTQYTLAIDRQNGALDRFGDPHHPAVLRLIQLAIDGAHKYGKWVGICGELAADLTLTETFVQMGVDELSAAPAMVLPLRKRIREIK